MDHELPALVLKFVLRAKLCERISREEVKGEDLADGARGALDDLDHQEAAEAAGEQSWRCCSRPRREQALDISGL